MFPDDLYIASTSDKKLYKVVNDVVSPADTVDIHNEVRSILVCQNMIDVYMTNRNNASITRISKGNPIGDIPVGNTPYALCEDPDGVIYVSNYSDNTVSVIQNNEVVDTINVDAGPRGLFSDENGNIYVACYLSNTLCKIVNGMVTKHIVTGYNPEAVICDIFNNIWVTCAGSNIVSRYTRDYKTLDVQVGKVPIALTTDSKGSIYVANYEDDTVSMIPNNGSAATITIPVGDGPTALATNSKGFVYVTSSLSGGDVKKINTTSHTVIASIPVCYSPMAFGDFTGYVAHLIFNPEGSSGTSGLSTNQEKIVASLKLTFKVVDYKLVGSDYIFEIDSDDVDLSKFDHITLNKTAAIGTKQFQLPSGSVSKLILRGYYDADDSNPITFEPVKFSHIFEVIVGQFDSGLATATKLNRKVVTGNEDIVTVPFTLTVDGSNAFVLLPATVAAVYKNTVVINGMPIDNDWDPDLTDPTVVTVNNAIKTAFPGYKIFINPYTADAGTSFLLNYYKAD